jgi:hypothetical protein
MVYDHCYHRYYYEVGWLLVDWMMMMAVGTYCLQVVEEVDLVDLIVVAALAVIYVQYLLKIFVYWMAMVAMVPSIDHLTVVQVLD